MITIDNHKLSLVIISVFHGRGILNKSQKLKNKRHRPPQNAKRDPTTVHMCQDLDCYSW